MTTLKKQSRLKEVKLALNPEAEKYWRTIFEFEGGKFWPGIFGEHLRREVKYFDNLCALNWEDVINGNFTNSYLLQMSYTVMCWSGSDHGVFTYALHDYYRGLLAMKVAYNKMKPNTKIRHFKLPPGEGNLCYGDGKVYKEVDNPFRDKNKKDIRKYVNAVKYLHPDEGDWNDSMDELLKTAESLIWRYERVYDYPIGNQDIGIWHKTDWNDESELKPESDWSEVAVLQMALEWGILKNKARKVLYEKKEVVK